MMAHLEGRKLTGRIVQRKNINVERDVVCGTMQDQNMARWMYSPYKDHCEALPKQVLKNIKHKQQIQLE